MYAEGRQDSMHSIYIIVFPLSDETNQITSLGLIYHEDSVKHKKDDT